MVAEAVHTIGPRDRILDAAESLFAQRGMAGVGMREVAETAGLGKSTLFHHFRSKAELYAAVALRILETYEIQLTAALARGGDPLERFDRWLDCLMDLLAEDPRSARLFLRSLFEDDDSSGASDPEKEADAVITRILDGLGRLLREGTKAGVFRVASIPHTIQSLIGLTIYHFASGEFGDQLLGASVFSPGEVSRRKHEVKALLHGGLLAAAPERSR